MNEYKAKENRRGEDSSCPKGVRETAKKGYPDPENFGDPVVPPQDYDVRQSGRVLELQNRHLWIRPTDLSWHFPILVTIRQMPFKNYHSRSPAKLKVREDKIEEAKKQKIPKSGDEEWNSTRWKYSSFTWTTSSSSSAWQEWSADETRKRTSWQSADWDSSDQVRKVTAWQASADWNTSDQTREHPDWQSYADWNSLKHTRGSYHQSIGAIQIERVNVIHGSCLFYGSKDKKDLMLVDNIYKGIHDNENNVCL